MWVADSQSKHVLVMHRTERIAQHEGEVCRTVIILVLFNSLMFVSQWDYSQCYTTPILLSAPAPSNMLLPDRKLEDNRMDFILWEVLELSGNMKNRGAYWGHPDQRVFLSKPRLRIILLLINPNTWINQNSTWCEIAPYKCLMFSYHYNFLIPLLHIFHSL